MLLLQLLGWLRGRPRVSMGWPKHVVGWSMKWMAEWDEMDGRMVDGMEVKYRRREEVDASDLPRELKTKHSKKKR